MKLPWYFRKHRVSMTDKQIYIQMNWFDKLGLIVDVLWRRINNVH
jgi:hypothetical protein